VSRSAADSTLSRRAPDLFGSAPLPDGFVYRPGFLDSATQAALLRSLQGLPFQEAPYRQYTAKRRIVMFEIVPPFLDGLRDRIASWLGWSPSNIAHALATEYRPGTQLGWHRDSPPYEEVAGVSLGTPCIMRLRPRPRAGAAAPPRNQVIKLDLEPGSAYSMSGAARWDWQHSIAPTPGLRYSITFRTPRRT
jgi:alkylated DNA repair dioxygenase AlkB